MGWFVFAIILWVIALIALVASPWAKFRLTDSYGRGTGRVANLRGPFIAGGLVCVLLGFGLFVLAGGKSVPTKSIGVTTVIGRVAGGVLQPGWHETWTPWESVHVIDETIQTTTFEGCQGQFCQPGDVPGVTTPPAGDDGSSTAPCLEVRLGGGQTGCLDVTIQWQVLDSAATGLFSDYANQGPLMPTVENAVVIRELRQVANNKLGDFNPILDAQSQATGKASQADTFEPSVLAAMNADIGNRITIRSILMPLLRYDHTTQDRLNSIAQQVGNTAIALQQIQTDIALARANGKLGTPNLNVLVQECLNIVANAEKDRYTGLPVGFSCMPGGASSLALSKG